jgi:hypothetical protein
MWNYLQGGTDNYSIDREAGDAYAGPYPEIFYLAGQVRQFLERTVRWVASEAGVRQFFDIGCGLPAQRGLRNTHEVAQAVDPRCRVVYVDNDPVVYAHAQALLVSTVSDGGEIAYIEADARDTDNLIAQAANTINFTEPVAVLLMGILGALRFDEALAVVGTLMRAIPTGSYLIFSDGRDTESRHEALARRNETGINRYELRTREQMARYFDGLDMVEPGIVPVTQWRPEPVEVGTLRPVEGYGGVGRKS